MTTEVAEPLSKRVYTSLLWMDRYCDEHRRIAVRDWVRELEVQTVEHEGKLALVLYKEPLVASGQMFSRHSPEFRYPQHGWIGPRYDATDMQSGEELSPDLIVYDRETVDCGVGIHCNIADDILDWYDDTYDWGAANSACLLEVFVYPEDLLNISAHKIRAKRAFVNRVLSFEEFEALNHSYAHATPYVDPEDLDSDEVTSRYPRPWDEECDDDDNPYDY